MNGFWGRKVGMTQVFAENNKVVPVTAVDTSGWFVSQLKTKDADGYDAVQVAYVRTKHQGKPFDKNWLKQKSKNFRWVKEIPVKQLTEDMKIGSIVNFASIIQAQDTVDVTGVTKGCGFAGVMRRHNFAGGPKSHGSSFKRRPGGLSFMCANGKVIKGKAMPGHMGVKQRTVKNLKIAQVRVEDNLVLISGSMAGKSGSLVYVRKCG